MTLIRRIASNLNNINKIISQVKVRVIKELERKKFLGKGIIEIIEDNDLKPALMLLILVPLTKCLLVKGARY